MGRNSQSHGIWLKPRSEKYKGGTNGSQTGHHTLLSQTQKNEVRGLCTNLRELAARHTQRGQSDSRGAAVLLPSSLYLT